MKVNIISNSVVKSQRARHAYGPTCGIVDDHFSRITFSGMSLALNLKDSALCLEDGTFVRATNFIQHYQSQSWHVIGKMFTKSSDFYSSSRDVLSGKFWA